MSRRLSKHWLVLATLAGGACATHTVGCGGGNSTTLGGPDSGSDSSSEAMDATTDASGGDDSEAMDSGNAADVLSSDASDSAAKSTDASDATSPDAGAVPDAATGDASTCPDGTACANGNSNGICSGGTCVACDSGATSAGAFAACTSAYGAGTSPYVCSSGSCLPGNCNSNADCTAAGSPTCGFATPNVCGGCTNDTECASGTICDTAAADVNFGKCVAATSGCSAAATDTTCSLNASDECCSGSCVSGNCCYPTANATAFCGNGTTCTPDLPGETAGGGICTTCAAVTGTSPTFYVDPVHGNDTTGTGNNSVQACAFQTITRALQVIGSTAPAGTTIKIVNTAASGAVTVQGVATGTPGTGQEKFPIVVPAKVTLMTSGGAVIIKVPAKSGNANTTGLVLAGNPSAIAGGSGAPLTIDGQGNTATTGIVVQSAGATLSALTVQNFLDDGISVVNAGSTASALAINAGVQSNGSGIEGLFVGGSSTATITGTSAAPTQFNNNGAHGIDVRQTASITITGEVGASPPSTSTVIASGNTAADIWIEQTAGTSAKNALTGVVCTTSNGNGLRIVPGSNATVRNSWLLGNTGSGIDIENAVGGAGNAIGNIDLGTAASPGQNVLQAVPGGSVNGNAGVCLALAAGANGQLAARGNVFGGSGATPINCNSGPGALHVAGNLKCNGHADVGGNIVAFPNDAGTGNTIDVTQCTY
jgi:hypothetical protein